MSRYEPGGGRGDNFRLDVDPVGLAAAETQLADAQEYLTGRARVATFAGDPAGWTGAAANACLRETENISISLRRTALKFEAAAEGVKTFRRAVLTAQDELAKLNADWAQSENDFQTAVDKTKKAMEAPGPTPTPSPEPAHFAELQRLSTQGSLTGKYDVIVTSLGTAARACGTALAASAPINFSGDQWTKVRGGNFDITVWASVHSQAFGGQGSFVGELDGSKAGEYVAGKLDDQAKSAKMGDKLDPEVVALMDQMKGNAGFAQTLLTKLGPGGAAFLNMRVVALHKGGDEQGRQLLGILTDLYATGSKVLVPTGDGQSRPLMDKAWLDNFNIDSYDQARYFSRDHRPVRGYRPDLLLPFMNKAGVFSSDFSQLVTEQALEDYEKFKSSSGDRGYIERWGLYSGNSDGVDQFTGVENRDATSRDTGDLFRTELFHIALDRTAEHPLASNAVMTSHRDTMLGLMTGKDVVFTGGDRQHDWASPALAEILKKSTIGLQGGSMYDLQNADSALRGVADYLATHQGEHMVKNVEIALGAVVTDPRIFDGAMSSVTGPFGAQLGVGDFRDDPYHPERGPLMASSLWATLHREAMRQPESARMIIRQVGIYINKNSKLADDLSYQSAPKGQWVWNDALGSMERYQSDAARQFLVTNFQATRDATLAELEGELAAHGKTKDTAKEILRTMVAWATDPLNIVEDVGGAVTGLAVEGAMSTKDIEGRYETLTKAQDALLLDPVIKPAPWAKAQEAGDRLIRDMLLPNVLQEVDGLQEVDELPQGLTDPRQAPPKTYDGDPRRYIGHVSNHPSVGSDDFLLYGTDGLPVKVKPPGEMNSFQREAYTQWLHDPAVQNRLANKLSDVRHDPPVSR
jgi:hypothetical protein